MRGEVYHSILSCLTRPPHNCTLKEATIKRYHYQTTAELTTRLLTCLVAYNYAKRLKRLKGLTPTNSFAPNGGKILLSLIATLPATPFPILRDHTPRD